MILTFTVEAPLEVVNIPWLSDTAERRLGPGSPSSPGSPGSPSASNESRFSVNLREVLDPSRSSFAVRKGEGLDLVVECVRCY